MQTVLLIIYFLLFLWCVPAPYFDFNSTMQFKKRGTGQEAGWFGLMAWLQAKFPNSWGWIKAALMWVIGFVIAFGIPALGRHFSLEREAQFVTVAILGVLCFRAYIAIQNNYALSK